MADGGEGIRRNGGDAMRHNRWSVRVTVKRASPGEDSPKAIWTIINANRKTEARIKAINHILKVIPQREQYVIK